MKKLALPIVDMQNDFGVTCATADQFLEPAKWVSQLRPKEGVAMRRRCISAPSVLGLVAVALVSCGGDGPKTPAELAAAVAKSRTEAEAARAARDVKAARKAAERAADWTARLRRISEGQDAAATEAKGVLAAADADARAAREWAELADEERRIAALLGSLKAKAYRAGRAALLAGVFKGLALAADQAAAKGLAGLPPKVQEAAGTAASLAAEFSGRKPLADGSPDWKGISADMSAFAAAPPERLALLLSAAWMLAGRGGPALWELSLVGKAEARDDREQLIRQFLPALVYRLNGCPRMAVRELQAALALEGLGPEERAWLHIGSAVLYLTEKDYGNADLELGRALKATPNHPVAAYLTGERLAADGQWEKAAESLEAAGGQLSEDRWLAERLADRARQVRDAKGGDQPLFLDKGFLVKLVLEAAGQAAKRSDAGKRIKSWIETSGALGRLLGEQPEPEAKGPAPAG